MDSEVSSGVAEHRPYSCPGENNLTAQPDDFVSVSLRASEKRRKITALFAGAAFSENPQAGETDRIFLVFHGYSVYVDAVMSAVLLPFAASIHTVKRIRFHAE